MFVRHLNIIIRVSYIYFLEKCSRLCGMHSFSASLLLCIISLSDLYLSVKSKFSDERAFKMAMLKSVSNKPRAAKCLEKLR